ncbi:peptidase C14, caspase domain-containing protein [Fusarium oxysporum f. sp. albedinis]|nr:peptidase C14, caspase domain-containing protein [Fusarium oxysporum f. sp. albedinis]
MTAYLSEQVGYKREDMVILTDDQQNPMSQPTKQTILRAMHWLVEDAQPNDSLFFHYSDMDKVICSVDFRQTGPITENEMHRIMVHPLQAGVRLTAIFDSCHSGTALGLPYIYSTQGILKAPNLAKEEGQGLLGVISSYSQGDLGGVASNHFGFIKKAATGDEVHERNLRTKTSPADVIMWTGSRDDQTSVDATLASQATGAMTWAFVTALKKSPQQSYVQLLNSIRDELATRYTQKPHLSCSHPLDTNLLFVM